MKLGMLSDDNVLIMHVILFHRHMKIVVALVMEIVKVLQKHGSRDNLITKLETWYMNR